MTDMFSEQKIGVAVEPIPGKMAFLSNVHAASTFVDKRHLRLR